MPFVVHDVLQYKRNDRQIREIHEREYSKYLLTVDQQPVSHNAYYLSKEHFEEVERSKLRFHLEKKKQYERIKRENDVISQRLNKARKRPLVDDKNHLYKRNLEIFNSKHSQQRINDYKRINNENNILMKRFNRATTQLVSKQQCDQEWQQHINVMKKTCDYPEKIDQFVSNVKKNQHKKVCYWDQQINEMKNISQLTENPLNVLLQLSE